MLERGWQLTTKANPRTTVEREILPSMSGVFLPPLGTEGMGVGAVEVRTAMHGIDTVRDGVTFLDVDRGFLVWSAAQGQRCVLVCDTEVKWDGGL